MRLAARFRRCSLLLCLSVFGALALVPTAFAQGVQFWTDADATLTLNDYETHTLKAFETTRVEMHPEFYHCKVELLDLEHDLGEGFVLEFDLDLDVETDTTVKLNLVDAYLQHRFGSTTRFSGKQVFEAVNHGGQLWMWLEKRRVDINSADADGKTPLHHAALGPDAGVLNRLLALKADPKRTDRAGNTPLHLAAGQHIMDDEAAPLVEALLKAGALVDAPNHQQETALMLSARLGLVKTSQLLLKYGAKTGRRDSQGRTVLQQAEGVTIKKLLRSYGAR